MSITERLVVRSWSLPSAPLPVFGRIGRLMSRSSTALAFALSGASVLLALAIIQWPADIPKGSFAILVVISGLFLEPAKLGPVYILQLICYVGLVTLLPETRTLSGGVLIVLLIEMLLMFWLSAARSKVGVTGLVGESMLVDMRERLERQGTLPTLPSGWAAESAVRSAFGDRFAGDFVVARQSRDKAHLEIALVDVSGKGRDAGARSLMLSGALAGILGAMPDAAFLSAANNHLLDEQCGEDFATVAHLALNLETGDFSIGHAGHPTSVQYFAGAGRWRPMLDARGPVLGVVESAEFPRATGRMERGDCVLLYSDGVIESRSRSLIEGYDRMLGNAEARIGAGFSGLAAWLCERGAAGASDDRAVVAVWRR